MFESLKYGDFTFFFLAMIGQMASQNIQMVVRAYLAYLLTGSYAILGVVAGGVTLAADDPAGSAFRAAAGEAGLRVFGLILWSAALTSVIGAAYTSVSFLRDLHPSIDRHWHRAVIVLITLSTLIFVLTGRPARTLVLVGTLNGLILPLALGTMIIAAHRVRIVGDYRHPRVLTIAGGIAAVVMAVAGAYVIWRDLPALFR